MFFRTLVHSLSLSPQTYCLFVLPFPFPFSFSFFVISFLLFASPLFSVLLFSSLFLSLSPFLNSLSVFLLFHIISLPLPLSLFYLKICFFFGFNCCTISCNISKTFFGGLFFFFFLSLISFCLIFSFFIIMFPDFFFCLRVFSFSFLFFFEKDFLHSGRSKVTCHRKGRKKKKKQQGVLQSVATAPSRFRNIQKHANFFFSLRRCRCVAEKRRPRIQARSGAQTAHGSVLASAPKVSVQLTPKLASPAIRACRRY